MITKLFAARLAEYGVSVIEIRPGIIETDMTITQLDDYLQIYDIVKLYDYAPGIPGLFHEEKIILMS